MRIGFIILGAVLMGISWWMNQPFQTDIFGIWTVQLPNPLQPFSIPVAISGVGSCTYGFFSDKKKRR